MSNCNRSFTYNYTSTKNTVVHFDIAFEKGKKVARNITLISNWRVHYPQDPQIVELNGQFGFLKDGIFVTNGDIQQIIKRVFKLVEESTLQTDS